MAPRWPGWRHISAPDRIATAVAELLGTNRPCQWQFYSEEPADVVPRSSSRPARIRDHWVVGRPSSRI